MPKRSRKGPGDPNQLAKRIVEQATGDPGPEEKPPKNPSAVALGRLGGLKGGVSRAAKLSPKKRSAIAKAAADARWKKRHNEDGNS